MKKKEFFSGRSAEVLLFASGELWGSYLECSVQTGAGLRDTRKKGRELNLFRVIVFTQPTHITEK